MLRSARNDEGQRTSPSLRDGGSIVAVSGEAIQAGRYPLDCFAPLAMTRGSERVRHCEGGARSNPDEEVPAGLLRPFSRTARSQ
ncbi:MAG: hypothetical protein LBT00_12470 [Spirochaetaceae bacterium]|nr:hypothetical protein [Spirochaetaceae bacterium]